MSEVEGNIAYMETGYEPATPPHTRTTPSGAVDWAWEKLKQHHSQMIEAVDIGCGRGRNSLFLARKGLRVTSMDFAPNAIEALQKMTIRLKLCNNVRAFVQDITEDWPIKPHTIDLAIDAFCFKHLETLEAAKSYKTNLLQILTVHGHYLMSLSSIGDGYYGHYMRRPGQAPMPVDDAVDIDPVNGVESPIFSHEKLIEFMAPELEVCAELKGHDLSSALKDDGTYALLFRRSSKWVHS